MKPKAVFLFIFWQTSLIVWVLIFSSLGKFHSVASVTINQKMLQIVSLNLD